MTTVQAIITDILRAEGGFTSDPKDRAHYGKATDGKKWDCYCTNRGITQATLSDYLNRQATIDEVKNLSEALAREIYEKRYVTDPRFHMLPAIIQPAMIDAGVHSGPRRSGIFLQQVLNAAGYGPLSVDGAVGPATRAEAEKAAKVMKGWLVNGLVEQRRMYLEALIAKDPSQERFRRGWMARLAKLEVKVT